MYSSVHEPGTRVYTDWVEHEPVERTTREVREHLADVVNAAIRGRVTYITSRGRRVAAVVPLATADQTGARPPSPSA